MRCLTGCGGNGSGASQRHGNALLAEHLFAGVGDLRKRVRLVHRVFFLLVTLRLIVFTLLPDLNGCWQRLHVKHRW